MVLFFIYYSKIYIDISQGTYGSPNPSLRGGDKLGIALLEGSGNLSEAKGFLKGRGTAKRRVWNPLRGF